jgi:hypothetical protein
VAQLGEPSEDFSFDRETTVIAGDGDFHAC